MIKVYAISGLGVDERAFSKLNLDFDFEVIPWIKAQSGETIASFARRMAESIDTSQRFGLIGLSFGGMLSMEIAKFMNPEFIILISSAETHREQRWTIRGPWTQLVKLFPSSWCIPPKWVVYKAFGAEDKPLVSKIMDDTDPDFVKWAIPRIAHWDNTDRFEPIFKICGSRDLLFTCPKGENISKVEGAGHFMVVDRADDVSKKVNSWVRENKLIRELV